MAGTYDPDPTILPTATKSNRFSNRRIRRIRYFPIKTFLCHALVMVSKMQTLTNERDEAN